MLNQCVYRLAKHGLEQVGRVPNLEESTSTAGRLFCVNDRLYASSGVGISVLHDGAFHYERKCLGQYYSHGQKCVLLKEGKALFKVKPDFTEEEITKVDTDVTKCVLAAGGVVVFGNTDLSKQIWVDIVNGKAVAKTDEFASNIQFKLSECGAVVPEEVTKRVYGQFRRVSQVTKEQFTTWMET